MMPTPAKCPKCGASLLQDCAFSWTCGSKAQPFHQSDACRIREQAAYIETLREIDQRMCDDYAKMVEQHREAVKEVERLRAELLAALDKGETP